MSPVELTVIGFFGLWIGLSILVYIPKLNPFIRGRDRLSLIPEWRFFAPIPGQFDYHILYRDHYEDGATSQWRELETLSSRSLACCLWNPDKRRKKALFDAVTEFATHVQREEPLLAMTMPYLSLLQYVSNVPRSDPATHTQFMLMASEGIIHEEKPPKMMAISDTHRL